MGSRSPQSAATLGQGSARTMSKTDGSEAGPFPCKTTPLISLYFEVDICFLIFASDLVCNVPLNSRCFATSGREVGFLGETLPSALNDIWLIPFSACWKSYHQSLKLKIYILDNWWTIMLILWGGSNGYLIHAHSCFISSSRFRCTISTIGSKYATTSHLFHFVTWARLPERVIVNNSRWTQMNDSHTYPNQPLLNVL